MVKIEIFEGSKSHIWNLKNQNHKIIGVNSSTVNSLNVNPKVLS